MRYIHGAPAKVYVAVNQDNGAVYPATSARMRDGFLRAAQDLHPKTEFVKATYRLIRVVKVKPKRKRAA